MILEVKNIDKSFGEKEVLKGVSFAAEGGKAFGLLDIPQRKTFNFLCVVSHKFSRF